MAQSHSGHEYAVQLTDDRGHAVLASGNTVPADGASGYAKGCLFRDVNAAAGSILFCNEGDETSCDFDAVTVA